MADGDLPDYPLTIPRGATWPAHAWVLLDATGQPLREPPPDPTVVAKIRGRRSDSDVLHTFTGQIVMLTIPGQYGGQPVVAAQLAAIPHTVTAVWTWDTGEWDMLIGWEPVLGGTVSAPLLVSR